MIPLLVELTDYRSGKPRVLNAALVEAIYGEEDTKDDGTKILFTILVTEVGNRYSVAESPDRVAQIIGGIFGGMIGEVYEFWQRRLQRENRGSERADSIGGASLSGEGAGSERGAAAEDLGGS